MALKVCPYLVFNGNTKEVVSFYQQVLDAELIGITTFGDMPASPEYPLPEEAKDRVAHAMLKIGGSEMMFSDTFPGMPFQAGGNIDICISAESAERAKQVFDALAEGGQVKMPLQETHWSPAYGQVTDKYGTSFQITTEPQK